MKKMYNYSASPSSMPAEITEEFAKSLVEYGDSGLSILEIDSTHKEYSSLLSATKNSLRSLMKIPANYTILFVEGGQTTQYSAVPLNLLSSHKCADYVLSGQASKAASLEAKKYADVAIAATSAGASPAYSTIPDLGRNDFRPDSDYVHICFNNVVYGTKYHYIPDTGNIPLVADMSSILLSEPLEVSKFGMIYAGTGYNLSPPGFSVLIIRDDLFGSVDDTTPDCLNYKLLASGKSLCHNPPAYFLHAANLTFNWISSIGGLEEMKRRNERKASKLYDYLDGQSYYTNPVDKKCRSMMNVVFLTGDAAYDKRFLEEAREEGLIGLEGDSSIGGMRASIYNSMPIDGVEKLVSFMKRFAQENLKL